MIRTASGLRPLLVLVAACVALASVGGAAFARRAAAAAAAAAAARGNRPSPIGPPDHWGEGASQPVRQTSFVVDPPNGRIPAVTAEGQKRAAGRDRGSFGTGPFNGPEDLTSTPHVGPAIRQYMGDARGHGRETRSSSSPRTSPTR
jgi:hypothetical protein